VFETDFQRLHHFVRCSIEFASYLVDVIQHILRSVHFKHCLLHTALCCLLILISLRLFHQQFVARNIQYTRTQHTKTIFSDFDDIWCNNGMQTCSIPVRTLDTSPVMPDVDSGSAILKSSSCSSPCTVCSSVKAYIAAFVCDQIGLGPGC